MMVRRHDVADRLVGNEFLRLRDHGAGSRDVVGQIHNNDMILHLNHEAVMRGAGKVIDALAHLLRVHLNRWRSG